MYTRISRKKDKDKDKTYQYLQLCEATGDYQFRAEFGVGVSCFQIVSLPKSEAW